MKLPSVLKGKESIQRNLLTSCHVFRTLLNIVVDTIIVKIYVVETMIVAIHMHLLYLDTVLS